MLFRNHLFCLSLLLIQTTAFAEDPAWQNLLPTIDISNPVTGEWEREGNLLKLKPAQAARIQLPIAPTGEYDFRVSFTRHTGRDSIAMMFVHGGKMATFEVDAWGEHLAGVQSIGGQDCRQNNTRVNNQSLENGRRYTMTVQVRRDRVHCLLDEKQLCTYRGTGADLSVVPLWQLPKAKQLGIGAWNSETTFHAIEVRSLSGTPFKTGPAIAMRPEPGSPTSPRNPATPVNPPPNRNQTPRNGAVKHALIVIANQDFFYREYADPREELEKAGIRVTVAAGTKSPCRPHPNSGQGNRSGIVQPDIALKDVNVKDYDAVLFSGGWGSSSYQYAFPGRYNTPSYNGNRAIKTQANRIVNEFLAADKYTCALCNAVSVLAWARVDGKSPLAGKRVCAPTRQAAAGIYNGRQAQPSCRWHPEANGAIMIPAGSLGRPGTAIDDISVDGKIITGEDDISAREMGRRMVEVLSR